MISKVCYTLSINKKSIKSLKKYPHITESYACILKIYVIIVDLSIKFLIFFLNMFYTKTVEISSFII